ncbi:MAG: hypothetical protein WBJ10_14680, partial [Daejeonella sp.]|uniref:hypothetical protein n=1 Tax=Daejeonella sp. TaxID=2805397 RepID=UPI003C780426
TENTQVAVMHPLKTRNKPDLHRYAWVFLIRTIPSLTNWEKSREEVLVFKGWVRERGELFSER